MAYTKTVWTDRQVTNPLRFTLNTVSTNVYDLIPTEGTVIQTGTPLNATNLNNIENGIASLDTSVTANSSAITTLQANRVLKAGDTMTGDLTLPNLIASGTISEGGSLLSAKYLAITGGTMSGDLTVSKSSATSRITAQNSADDTMIRMVTTGSAGVIQSSNNATSAMKNMTLEGFAGGTIPTLTLRATTTAITGSATVGGTLGVTGNTTLSGTLSSGAITESGTLLTAKYMQLNADNAMTGQLTLIRNGVNEIYKGTATGTSNLAYMQIQDSAGTVQGQFGKSASGVNDITVRALTGDLELTTNTGLVKVNDDLTVNGIITATGTVQTAIPATGVASLLLKNTADDSQVRHTTNATTNYIQSGNSAFGASKDFKITGINGTALPTLEIVATTTTITGNESLNGNLSISSVSTSPLIMYSPSGTGSDSQFKYSTTATFNYLQSSNFAGTAPKSLKITGQTASVVLDEIYLNGLVVKREGDVIARSERGTRIDNLVALGGNKVMTNTDVVTCNVNLADTPNGWMLEWRQSTSTAFLYYSYIYKFQGQGSVTHVPCGYNDPNVYAGKIVTVNNTTITGSTSNTVGNSNNRVLSAVYCF